MFIHLKVAKRIEALTEYSTMLCEQWHDVYFANERPSGKTDRIGKTLSSFVDIYLTEIADPFSFFSIVFFYVQCCCFVVILCHRLMRNTLERTDIQEGALFYNTQKEKWIAKRRTEITELRSMHGSIELLIRIQKYATDSYGVENGTKT